MFIDTHAHLFFKDFRHDLNKVIKQAQDAGVQYIINLGTDVETSRESIELAEKYEIVYSCVGFHPHEAKKADEQSLEEIEKLSHHPKVVGIGEIGLDYHYNFSPPERQREVFAYQIDIARRRNLPIAIHCREAEDDTLWIVDEKYKSGSKDHSVRWKGVFHCFSGDVAMAQKVIDWGFYISIPGPVTFGSKSSKPNSMVDVASRISMEHILLETDSPYLTPAPHRGKRNEPANIPIIAQKIAELQGLLLEEVAQVSTESACALFAI
ncbi:MAG: TatD family hydrolase, partial [Ignavibacteriae bacterium]|nr:TatD family hydrolase [Ignavibacteriota bacterium]